MRARLLRRPGCYTARWDLLRTGTLAPCADAAGGKNTLNTISQPSSALWCLYLRTQPPNICYEGEGGWH